MSREPSSKLVPPEAPKSQSRKPSAESGPQGSKIHPFFWPEAVAIVGVSAKGGFAADLLANVKKWGFSGPVVAVNPRYDEVAGVPCFPSLEAVPHPVDLAIVAVPSGAIQGVLEDCERAAVRGVQIITSGFAEQAHEGDARQRLLVDWSERTGIPVVGPNCFGLMNSDNRLMATPLDFDAIKTGGVGAILQSGTLVYCLVVQLMARGIGVGRVLTIGNEACVDVADVIDHFVDDEGIRVISCYSEQIKRPDAFIRACERAADAGKPIVMIKVGRSEASRQAAMAHTGSLVGSDVAVDALLKKLGVIRVDTVDDLIETTAALSGTKRPRGRRVAFASLSGSASSLLPDVAQGYDLEFPPLPEEVKTRLAKVFPEFGNLGNPLDLTAQADYDARIIGESLEALATCGAYDVVLWGRGFPSRIDMRSNLGRALTRASLAAPDVVFTLMSLAGGQFHAAPDPKATLLEPRADFEGMPFLQGMSTGLKALSALVDYAEFQRNRSPEHRLSDRRGHRSPMASKALEIIRGADGDALTEREGKRLLSLYGIPVTREALATTANEAARIAQDIGFPVAMKIEAADIIHKTDVGGVLLNITSPEDASAAFKQILASVRSRRPDASVSGVVVQQMVKPGAEMILGATFDPQFGPVIALGLGGVWVEALKDVRVLLPPFDKAEVQVEIGRLRAASVLLGGRGHPKADIDAFADCAVKFGALCTDLAVEITEIDINPIVLGQTGAGAVAVDCLVRPIARRLGH